MTLAMFIIGPWLWLIIPGILLGFYAQYRLMSTYGHYSKVANRSGLTGEQAARALLDSVGLRQMPALTQARIIGKSSLVKPCFSS